MAVRFYLVDKIGDGLTPATAYRPEYIADLGVKFEARCFGLESWCLVGADVTGGQHSSIAANSDVTVIPINLDNQIGAGNLAAVQNALENRRIPGQWVNSTHTYRQVIGIVYRVAQFLGRLHVRHLATIYQAGITLGTQMSELTQAQRDKAEDVFDSFGIDKSWITGATTVRQLLKGFADRMPSITMMGETF